MLWQQALASGKRSRANQMAQAGIRELQQLDCDFRAYWPLRNKGTTAKCSPFLQWRIQDYKQGILHFPPEVAELSMPKSHPAE